MVLGSNRFKSSIVIYTHFTFFSWNHWQIFTYNRYQYCNLPFLIFDKIEMNWDYQKGKWDGISSIRREEELAIVINGKKNGKERIQSVIIMTILIQNLHLSIMKLSLHATNDFNKDICYEGHNVCHLIFGIKI